MFGSSLGRRRGPNRPGAGPAAAGCRRIGPGSHGLKSAATKVLHAMQQGQPDSARKKSRATV